MIESGSREILGDLIQMNNTGSSLTKNSFM